MIPDLSLSLMETHFSLVFSLCLAGAEMNESHESVRQEREQALEDEEAEQLAVIGGCVLEQAI